MPFNIFEALAVACRSMVDCDRMAHVLVTLSSNSSVTGAWEVVHRRTIYIYIYIYIIQVELPPWKPKWSELTTAQQCKPIAVKRCIIESFVEKYMGRYILDSADPNYSNKEDG